MVSFGLVIFAILCAVMTIRAQRLLNAALWLAGVSVCVTIMLYLVGAYEMAVIELSLSLGLITVLLVFAISMVGANSPDSPAQTVSTLLRFSPVLLILALMILPKLSEPAETSDTVFGTVLWELRQPDILAQIALIFVGVIGVLHLLLHSDHHSVEAVELDDTLSRETLR